MGDYGGCEKVNYYKVNGSIIRTIGTLSEDPITREEFEEMEKASEETMGTPTPEPTAEERIAALEKDNAELREAMEALLSGVTA